MAFTFANQQSKLSQLLGDANTSSDDAWSLAARKSAINRGEIHFARDSKFLKDYATGTVASMELSMPNGWFETYMLLVDDYQITNKREIALQDYERYKDYNGDIPYYYFWEFSDTLKIKFLGNSDNVNGKTYKLYYFKKPYNAGAGGQSTELSDDDDESMFPDEYREAPVYWAAAELLEQISMTALADRYRQIYNSFVSRATLDAEKHYIKKEYPQPDFGDEDHLSEVDIQGKGYIW